MCISASSYIETMSRSRKHYPGGTWAYTKAGDQKSWKQAGNRRIRRNDKQDIKEALSYEDTSDVLPLKKYSYGHDVWNSPGDGKTSWYKALEGSHYHTLSKEELLSEYEKDQRK